MGVAWACRDIHRFLSFGLIRVPREPDLNSLDVCSSNTGLVSSLCLSGVCATGPNQYNSRTILYVLYPANLMPPRSETMTLVGLESLQGVCKADHRVSILTIFDQSMCFFGTHSSEPCLEGTAHFTDDTSMISPVRQGVQPGGLQSARSPFAMTKL